jgi:pyrroloquinoline quinone (PQQ) biosynthesis protein C
LGNPKPFKLRLIADELEHSQNSPRILRLPGDPCTANYSALITQLAEGVFDHPVLNCSFYSRWKGEALDLRQFETFASNYFHRVHATTDRVAIAMGSIPDWESKIELLHNLSDELGHGVSENVHVGVLMRWMESLWEKLGGEGELRRRESFSNPLQSTTNFVRLTADMCRKGAPEAAGALLAQEWHGYTQIAQLFEGFLNYRHLYRSEEFHDASEYFYVHLGRAEKEHRKQSTKIAIRNCTNDEDFKRISEAFNCYLNLLLEFWDGIEQITHQSR